MRPKLEIAYLLRSCFQPEKTKGFHVSPANFLIIIQNFFAWSVVDAVSNGGRTGYGSGNRQR
jgi:hypothetical protein